MKYSILLTVALMMTQACNIVENPNDINEQAEENANVETTEIAAGSGDIPADSAEFARLLHNNESKTWSAEEFTIEGLNGFLPCRLDDVITLFANGTYTYDGGTDLCGGEDDERTREGTWSFDFQSASLILEPGTPNETPGVVLTLEEDVIVVESIYNSNLFGVFEIAGKYGN